MGRTGGGKGCRKAQGGQDGEHIYSPLDYRESGSSRGFYSVMRGIGLLLCCKTGLLRIECVRST